MHVRWDESRIPSHSQQLTVQCGSQYEDGHVADRGDDHAEVGGADDV